MYHILPSEVASKATTFDLMILDLTVAWERQRLEEHENGSKPKVPTEAEMLEMVKASRIKNN